MKYHFIDTNRHSYAVKALCQALNVSTSGYYAARSRLPSARRERQTLLTSQIRAIHTASRHTYGAPRVHAELSAQGVACCRNTVAKLMHQAQIMPCRRRYDGFVSPRTLETPRHRPTCWIEYFRQTTQRLLVE